MAFGPQKYIDQAEGLARSLKRHMPGIRIAVISDRAMSTLLFDITVPMPKFEVAGTVHKKSMYDLSPFDETFFIDSDCLASRPFNDELDEIRQFEFSPVVTKYTETDGHDLYIADMKVALDGVNATKFPKFNGGVYFFKKGDVAAAVFNTANEILPRKVELGIKDFDKSGPGEETIIGLALGSLGLTDLYDDKGRLMRTPLNMTGSLEFDVLGGGCRFTKEGEIVTPALCHFCGPWAESAVYKLSIESIKTGKKPSFWKSQTEHASEATRELKKRITRKWNHLFKARAAA